jgi:hypothetical protein
VTSVGASVQQASMTAKMNAKKLGMANICEACWFSGWLAGFSNPDVEL